MFTPAYNKICKEVASKNTRYIIRMSLQDCKILYIISHIFFIQNPQNISLQMVKFKFAHFIQTWILVYTHVQESPCILGPKSYFFLTFFFIRLGVQPCVEVLRQLMTTGGVYDRQRLHHKALESANFIAACVPPSTVGIGSGTSSHALSPRITRLFSVLSFFVHSDEAMQLMHGSSLQGWLEEFPAYSLDHHKELAQVGSPHPVFCTVILCTFWWSYAIDAWV